MTLPLLAFGTEHISVVGWIVGVTLGIVVYVLVLLATRELTGGELRSLAGWLRTRLRAQDV